MADKLMEEFEAILQESFEMDTPEEGTVVKGKVIAIEAGQAIIDVGYKMEGRVELKEFADPGEAPEINVGDDVEVFLRSAENSKGEAVISREMARREEAWDRLEKAYAGEARVDGAIFGRVKADLPLIWAVLLRFCLALRLMSGQYGMRGH
jgi:small subunit ribosomal protein S1